MTLLLRNYIVRLKSDGHEDTGNVENMRSGIVNSSTNVDHVDDVAPWLNSHRSNIPSGIDANIHRPPPSGNILISRLIKQNSHALTKSR